MKNKDYMETISVAVIGGGAAGMTAAIAASREGARVTLFEGNDRVGKKLLSTGNGKCNLGTKYLSVLHYNSTDLEKVEACLKRFGAEDTVHFFEGLGLMVKDKDGYLYPVSEQASVVLDVLRIELKRQGVELVTGAKIHKIHREKDGRLTLSAKDGAIYASQRCFDRVILACGSKAAPKTGSDGSGYELAKALGHHVTEPVPALVQLRCRDNFCKALAGVRAGVCISIYQDKDAGAALTKEYGELQLTDYGISGIPVFQISGRVNRALKNQKELTVSVDFLPLMTQEEYAQFCSARMERRAGVTVEEFFTGMLNKKLMMVLIKQAGLQPGEDASAASDQKLEKVFSLCRNLIFHVAGSNSYDNAQVCSGGVDLREVTDELESVRMPGVYFAGELLDVDGRCGGYNLQWAWTSGHIAGQAAARRVRTT